MTRAIGDQAGPVAVGGVAEVADRLAFEHVEVVEVHPHLPSRRGVACGIGVAHLDAEKGHARAWWRRAPDLIVVGKVDSRLAKVGDSDVPIR